MARQILLIPEIVELDEADAARLVARAGELARFGLVIESFGPGAVAVRETPSLLGEVDVRGLLRDLAEHMAEWDDELPLERRLLHVSATMACYGSVRAGRRLKPEEMNALLREMEAVPNSGQCNHGRPTYVELKLGDIERLFGRKSPLRASPRSNTKLGVVVLPPLQLGETFRRLERRIHRFLDDNQRARGVSQPPSRAEASAFSASPLP